MKNFNEGLNEIENTPNIMKQSDDGDANEDLNNVPDENQSFERSPSESLNSSEPRQEESSDSDSENGENFNSNNDVNSGERVEPTTTSLEKTEGSNGKRVKEDSSDDENEKKFKPSCEIDETSMTKIRIKLQNEKIALKVKEKELEKERRKKEKMERKRQERLKQGSQQMPVSDDPSLEINQESIKPSQPTLSSFVAEIKLNLSINNANVDKCLQIMNSIAEMDISPKELSTNGDKFKELIQTLKKCRKYKADEKVRLEANKLLNKFKDYFNPGNVSWSSWIFFILTDSLSIDWCSNRQFSIIKRTNCLWSSGRIEWCYSRRKWVRMFQCFILVILFR